MNLAFFWPALGLTAGILMARAAPIPYAGAWAVFFLILPFLWQARGRQGFLAALVFEWILLGVLFSGADQARPRHALKNWLGEGYYAVIEGAAVTSAEIHAQGRKRRVSFVLQASRISLGGKNLQAFKTAGKVQVFLHQPAFVPEPGERLEIRGRLDRPRPAANPGQFDYARYLEIQGIDALLTAYGGKSVKSLGRARGRAIFRRLEKFRLRIEERIEALYSGEAAAAVKALIVGRRREIDPDFWEAMMKTGTSHLVAISGLNLALVAGSAYFFLIVCGLRAPQAAALSLVLSLLQVAVAGYGLPVQRAGIMAAVTCVSLMASREKSPLNTFFLAYTLMLMHDSRALESVSFVLSFLSVLSLIVILRRTHEAGWWREALVNSLAVMAGTLPVVLHYFHVFSPVSVLANFGAIPLFHGALVGSLLSLAAGGLPWIGPLCTGAVAQMLEAALAWIRFCSRLEAGYWYRPVPSAWEWAGYYGGLGTWCGSCYFYKRLPPAAAAVCLLAVLASVISLLRPPERGFQVTVLAAGKNEVAHVRLKHEDWLVNTGRAHPSLQARWTVAPYLRSLGTKRLAGVVLTSALKKHAGGEPYLAKHFRVLEKIGPWQLPADGARRLEREGGAWFLSRRGKALVIGLDSQGWKFLWLPDQRPETAVRIQKAGPSFCLPHVLVLPAAVTRWIEKEAFFDKLDPDIVVTSEEDPALEDFLEERGITLYVTQDLGALTFRPKAERLEVRSFLKGELKGLVKS